MNCPIWLLSDFVMTYLIYPMGFAFPRNFPHHWQALYSRWANLNTLHVRYQESSLSSIRLDRIQDRDRCHVKLWSMNRRPAHVKRCQHLLDIHLLQDDLLSLLWFCKGLQHCLDLWPCCLDLRGTYLGKHLSLLDFMPRKNELLNFKNLSLDCGVCNSKLKSNARRKYEWYIGG